MIVKRYCVINCEDSLAWNPVSFPDMFITKLQKFGNSSNAIPNSYSNSNRKGNNNNDSNRDSEEEIVVDEWSSIELAKGESLPDDLLSNYQGIVLTGSKYNCRDKEKLKWFEPLCNIIVSASVNGSPNIYGTCFGCQIIAHALGGVVDYNPTKRFVLKAEKIQLLPTFLDFLGSKSRITSDIVNNDECCYDTNTINTANSDSNGSTTLYDVKKSLTLIQSHGDCVLELPPNTALLGTSPTCINELYITGKCNNILAFQGHPEFDICYCITDRIWNAVVCTNKKLAEEDVAIAKETLYSYNDIDAELFLAIVYNFLSNKNSIISSPVAVVSSGTCKCICCYNNCACCNKTNDLSSGSTEVKDKSNNEDNKISDNSGKNEAVNVKKHCACAEDSEN